jgi:NADPH2:quinone reductase
MLFDNVTIRLLGSDDFPLDARRQAATDLTTAPRDGALSVPIGEPFPLEAAAAAHDSVDAGSRARVVLAVQE